MEESIEIIDTILNGMQIDKIDAAGASPLVLAYIGDAIYEVVIRTMVISESGAQVNKLHKMTSELVKAHAQAEIMKSLELTEEEHAVFKRGRNAKSVTMAKNATMSDYRNATGFEALMGYLYLSGRTERMLVLIRQGVDSYRQQKGENGCSTKN